MVIKSSLFKHQQDDVELIHNKEFWALVWDPGTGKTLGVAAIIDRRKQRFPKYRVLYICPNTLVESIAQDFTKHTDISYELVTGTRAQRKVKLDREATVYIINYEGARCITEELLSRKFDCLVLDESQNVKDHSSMQSKACFKLSTAIPHKLIMTGTPIMNCPLDVFGQYRVLSTKIFGPSWYRFRAIYAIMGGFMGKQVVKYIHMDDFKKRVLSCTSIRKKEECLDLPEQLYQTVHLDLPEAQTKMYKNLRDNFIAEFSDRVVTAPMVLTRLIRFSQITAGFYKDVEDKEHAFEKNPKQDWLVQWVKENNTKVVVFCRFIHEIKSLEARLRAEGVAFVSIFGETKDRMGAIKVFNESVGACVLIGQLDVAGAGINLQAASYTIFLSNNYSYGDRVQAEGRIHRSGQTQKCTYIDVVYRGTIDQSVLKILQKKESLASMLSTDIVRLV